MSSLNSIDIFFLEKIFGMSDGYVLDFSNRTFAEFFATEFNIDIDDDAYCANGQSKAKRLRCFFQKSNDAVTSKVLKALWSYREATRNFNEQAEDVPDAEAKFNEIIHRLEGGSSISKLDAIERFKNDETLEELISSIERDITAKKPQVALDRLHTYCMKKFAHLLELRGELPQPNETLNGRAGRYFNPLRRGGKFRPISDKIIKSTVEIFELFNSIRNNESLAHDNILIESNEARFIFDAIANMLRFVKSLEGVSFEAN